MNRLGDQRNHLTLVQKLFEQRTGYLPRTSWTMWVDLYAEAIRLEAAGFPKRKAHLETILYSSPTQGGWGTMRLVEGMKGEVKPDLPSAGAFLGAPTIINNGMTPNGQTNGVAHERPKRGLLSRIRGP
jgi:hypothetical protein